MTDAQPESPREALQFLWGSRVQRVDGPSPTLFAFTLYDQGQKQTLVFSLASPRPNLGLLAQRPSGDAASAFVRRLRVATENARFVSAHWLGGDAQGASALALAFQRAGERTDLVVDLAPARPNLYLLSADGTLTGAADERTRRAHFPGKASFRAESRASVALVTTREDALARGNTLVAQREQSSDDGLRNQARSQAKAQLKRLARKEAAIREDLARAESAPLLRREAGLLLSHLGAIQPGCREVTLEDWACDPPETLTVTLDPALTAQANAERRFTRARRLARGVAIAQKRLSETLVESEALNAFLAQVATDDASVLIQQGDRLGIKLSDAQHARSGESGRKSGQQHVPYRVFHGNTGARILVGKGAVDNDALTLTIARPHDLWLHARGLSGSHVIVPRERASDVPPELLLDAAHLAVHFSAARSEASAEVQHAERRYIRKPKGSAPGAVRVDRERVLLLRVEKARLERLLASETKP